MNQIITTTPQTEQDKTAENGKVILAEAKTTIVLTPEQYTIAVKRMNVAADFKKAVHDLMDPICDAANKSHKVTTTKRKDLLQPYEEAEKEYKTKLNDYDLEQERIRRAEEARQQKIRDDEAARIKKEQDEALAAALKLQEEGKPEEAEALVDDAADLQEQFEAMPEPVIEKNTPVGGVTFIDKWTAVITDPKAVPRKYCMPNQKLLDGYAKATKGDYPVAGVKFVNNRTVRRG